MAGLRSGSASGGAGVRARAVGAATLLSLLAACAATAPAPPMRIALPPAYAQAAGVWRPAPPTQPAGAWWRVFGAPGLDRLEGQVASHNQSLAAQLAAYDQARAAVDQARAAYFPTLSLGASGTRSKSAGFSSIVPIPGRIANNFTTSATASWVPDLWGRVRLQVRAGEANAAADAATLRGTLLSLQSTLAGSYLQLRTVDAQIRLGHRTVAAYRRALQITENRYRAGVGTAADVAQARTQLLQAQTRLTDLGVTRVQLQNAIAVLVGRPSAQFALAATATLPDVPEIPPGIPAQLLQRRPDLLAAQARVEAANADIGVAQRAWFPSLTLSGQAGSQGARLADLFTAPSLFWSLGPTLAATVFDGGLRRAQLASSRAAYRQTVANYREAVLGALQQVEDNLAAQRILAHEARQQAEVVRAAETSLRLAENQYRAGTASYLNVITAQTAATAARDAALTLRNRRYAAAVALIEALGGGWTRDGQATPPPPPRAGSRAKEPSPGRVAR